MSKTVIAINEPILLCIGEKLCKIQQEFKAKKADLILSGSTTLEVQRIS